MASPFTISAYLPIVKVIVGYGLGLLVRQRFPGILGGAIQKFASFFVKHRWMLQLIQGRGDLTVYASVLLTESFKSTDEITAANGNEGAASTEDNATANGNEAALAADVSGKPRNNDDRIVITGPVKDCYCASDGTLLYIVFDAGYTVRKADGSPTNGLRGMQLIYDFPEEQLLVEGKNVSLVRFGRTSIPAGRILGHRWWLPWSR